MRLFVLNLTSLDLRRVNSEDTPTLAAALERYPSAAMRNYPGNDILPTLLTGAYPGDHGVWGVTLRDQGISERRWTDALPDLVTTTGQCVVHLFGKEFDLAAVPPWRRRRFLNTRTKFRRFRRPHDVLAHIGGIPSLLGVLGPERAGYRFLSPTRPNAARLTRRRPAEYLIDWLELYSLNRFQQWNLDRGPALRDFYGRTDRMVAGLIEHCHARGVTLALVNEHGHEAVRDGVDLVGQLKSLGLGRDEYTLFLELAQVRFWFHTDRARHEIGDLLRALPNVAVLGREELAAFHLSFPDDSYGELFAFLEPGFVFFPHDFHHPFANLYLGLWDSKQRRRIIDARQRSNCGYLPDSPCEMGIMMLFDDTLTAKRETMQVIDVAPSIMYLLGREPLPTMKGTPVFEQA